MLLPLVVQITWQYKTRQNCSEKGHEKIVHKCLYSSIRTEYSYYSGRPQQNDLLRNILRIDYNDLPKWGWAPELCLPSSLVASLLFSKNCVFTSLSVVFLYCIQWSNFTNLWELSISGVSTLDFSLPVSF